MIFILQFHSFLQT